MPPRGRDRDGEPGPSGRGAGGGGNYSSAHRFAFVQHLMKHGCMEEAKAKEAFQRLTGSDSGAGYFCVTACTQRVGARSLRACMCAHAAASCTPPPKASNAAHALPRGADDLYRRMVGDQNQQMAAFNLQIRTLKYPVRLSGMRTCNCVRSERSAVAPCPPTHPPTRAHPMRRLSWTSTTMSGSSTR